MKKPTLSEKEWIREFEKNSSEIMALEKWKAIPDKSLKRELIRAWRKRYADKMIRETWGLKYHQYYYYLKKVDLKGAGGDVDSEEPHKEDSSGTQPLYIDAEFQVVDEGKAVIVPTTPDASSGMIAGLIMSFQESGTPERIMKRLKAIAANLELEEGELELSIQVWRKS